MAFTMKNDKVNRERLDKLGVKTKAMAYKWYNWLIKKEIDILITETTRSLEAQKKNVAKGASQTLRSYHLVGQALDFVPVVNGSANYDYYRKFPYDSAIRQAKRIGFSWGGDWSGSWDKPHLENKTIAYGTDTFKNKATAVQTATTEVRPTLNKGDHNVHVIYLQKELDLKMGGVFDEVTLTAVKRFQKAHGLVADGVFGAKSWKALDEASRKPTIRNGSNNAYVTYAQKKLGIKVTGVFGDSMESAIRKFQKDNGLVADGVLGHDGWIWLG